MAWLRGYNEHWNTAVHLLYDIAYCCLRQAFWCGEKVQGLSAGQRGRKHLRHRGSPIFASPKKCGQFEIGEQVPFALPADRYVGESICQHQLAYSGYCLPCFSRDGILNHKVLNFIKSAHQCILQNYRKLNGARGQMPGHGTLVESVVPGLSNRLK